MYKLLIADDEPSILRMYQRILTRTISRLEFECVNDGQEALVKFLSNPPSYNLVITDNLMPNMMGIEFLKSIKGYDVPKLFISGTLNNKLIQQAKQYGARIMNKPFEPVDLVKNVNELLGIHKLQQ